jgi:hypothetical protein
MLRNPFARRGSGIGDGDVAMGWASVVVVVVVMMRACVRADRVSDAGVVVDGADATGEVDGADATGEVDGADATGGVDGADATGGIPVARAPIGCGGVHGRRATASTAADRGAVPLKREMYVTRTSPSTATVATPALTAKRGTGREPCRRSTPGAAVCRLALLGGAGRLLLLAGSSESRRCGDE